MKATDTNPIAKSYNEFPYAGYAYYQSAPDTLATLAKISGMQPAPIERSRMLELGCATGRNLIPHAINFPESEFVGVDLSIEHIKIAREFVDQLGLKNINFIVGDLSDLEPNLGEFDFIVGHGIFSWISQQTQHNILSLCSKALSEQGVVYLSYNAYPGWHFHGIVRGLLSNWTHSENDFHQKLAQGKALLNELVETNKEKEEFYHVFLRSELESLEKMDDSYLVHEYLELYNRPLYFKEFMAMAESHGLDFLAETNPAHMFPDDEAEQTELIKGASKIADVVQGLDYLNNTRFHTTLLCRKGHCLDYTWEEHSIDDFYVTSFLEPKEHIRRCLGGKPTEFEHGNVSVSTQRAEEIGALRLLYEKRPQRFKVKELIDTVHEELREEAKTAIFPEQGLVDYTDEIRVFLRRLFKRSCIDLHTHPGRHISYISEYPCTTSFSRIECSLSDIITTQVHRPYRINQMEKALLPLLDGQHSKKDIVSLIKKAIESGSLKLPGTENHEDLESIARDCAHFSLYALCHAGLLVA